jgi:YD repeat-containing protein
MFAFFLKSQRAHISYFSLVTSLKPENYVSATRALFAMLGAIVLLLFSAAANAAEDDCIENGGTYVCTSPVWAETPNTGDNGYVRGVCDVGGVFQARSSAWCVAYGGTPSGVSCSNADPIIRSDSAVNSKAMNFINALYPNACMVTIGADSGWGATRTGGVLCANGSTVYDGTDEVGALKEFVITVQPRDGNGVCTASVDETFVGSRSREKSCPTGYNSRVRANVMECYLPAPCEQCPVGNPVDASNGTKRQVEVDYRSPTNSGLDLIRYYNSAAYTENDYSERGVNNFWKNNFQSKFVFLGNNNYVMGKAIRSNGRVIYFTNDFKEKFNFKGGGHRLAVVNGGGWKIITPEDEVEVYDGAGRLSSITKPNGNVLTITYQSPYNNALLAVSDSYGRSMQFSYVGDNIASVTLPDQSQIAYQYAFEPYSRYKRFVGVTNALGKTRQYLYEDSRFNWALTGIIDENGSRFSTYVYNTQGQVVGTEHAGGVDKYTLIFGDHYVGTTTPSSQYAYSADARDVRVSHRFEATQGVYKTAFTTYDIPENRGNPHEIKMGYDANGNKLWRTDKNGNVTSYTYDGVRNLEVSQSSGKPGAFEACPSGSTFSDTYLFGAPCPFKNVCFSSTTFAGASPVVIIPANGIFYLCPRPLATSAATSSLRTISTAWHADFRKPTLITAAKQRTVYKYHGTAGVSCAPAGASLQLVCEKRLEATPDPDGGLGIAVSPDAAIPARVWVYTYNLQGQMLTSTDPRGNTTTYTYHGATTAQVTQGDLASVSNALGHVTQFPSYNKHGQALQVIDANNIVTTMSYDLQQRLLSRTIASGTPQAETTTYEYDDVGQLKKVTMPNASFMQYQYDPAHRLTQISDSLGNKIRYSLDLVGNRIGEITEDPTGLLARVITREFDSLNRIKILRGGTTPQPVTENVHDLNNNMTKSTDPLGRVTDHVYDALNRLLSTQDPATPTRGTTAYAYDNQDNLTKVTDAKGLITTYTYNGLGDLTQLQSPDTGTQTYTQDSAGNVLTATDARGVVTTTSYDALNRATTISYSGVTAGITAASPTTYIYDACANGKGRLCSLTDAAGTISYQYDTLGRVTQKQQAIASPAATLTVNYTFGAGNKLLSQTYPSTKALTFTHNANAQVTAMNFNGTAVLSNAQYVPFGPMDYFTYANGKTYERQVDLDGRITKFTLPSIDHHL